MGLWGPQHLAVAIMISSCLWPGGFFSCCHASMGRWNPRLSRPLWVTVESVGHWLSLSSQPSTKLWPKPLTGTLLNFHRTPKKCSAMVWKMSFPEQMWFWGCLSNAFDNDLPKRENYCVFEKALLYSPPNRKSGSESDKWFTPSNAMMVG